MKKPKKVAILTSGGDAPGMNAAVRGAVRAALNKGWEVYAIKEGYRGPPNRWRQYLSPGLG